ncbi:MAG TPA: CvpA family protein [Candidatus Limnocylindrales bacterium]
MERLQTFDLVIFLALLAMFVVGYAQGVVRRLLGIGAIIFSIVLASQLRDPLGQYLSNQWTTIATNYSHMIAFGAVFFASAVTLSLAIQIMYRPAPLFDKYPVLDEILGGLLGVLEGFIILIAILLTIDPYFTRPEFHDHPGLGEFGLLRSLFDFMNPTLTAAILRENVIPGILAVVGFLFTQDVRDAFARALTVRR